jgi:hypothetical protein
MTTAYATYSYYTTTYLGTEIASADFAQLALRASAMIDRLTFNRAAAIIAANTPAETVDAIQMATCAVAEEIQSIESAGNNDGISSERIGNYSVTYTANAAAQMTRSQKLSVAAALYLASTGLMYRGFASGEYGGAITDDD